MDIPNIHPAVRAFVPEGVASDLGKGGMIKKKKGFWEVPGGTLPISRVLYV